MSGTLTRTFKNVFKKKKHSTEEFGNGGESPGKIILVIKILFFIWLRKTIQFISVFYNILMKTYSRVCYLIHSYKVLESWTLRPFSGAFFKAEEKAFWLNLLRILFYRYDGLNFRIRIIFEFTKKFKVHKYLWCEVQLGWIGYESLVQYFNLIYQDYISLILIITLGLILQWNLVKTFEHEILPF